MNKPLKSIKFPDLENTYTIPKEASDIGAIASPSSPSTGDVLVYDGSEWTAEPALTDVVSDITDLKSDISVLEPTATSSDVGKALIAKIVADGKVTEYEFGEAGGGSIETASATLLSNGWSNNEQTVNVTGVTASNTVIVSPSPSSMSDYTDAGIICSAQASGTLTFECESVPRNAVTVNIVIVR